MKTYYKSYGVSASITDNKDGRAKLVAKTPSGKTLHNKYHANRKAALSAWYRLCN